ncbi:MAG: CDGSH iron-sulfur domain-containing protein, partial [Candidatus Accumulibacter sp.]|nr:CDGSH iron-sulfur domain-containing protein [Accumulibacter sp.]
MTASKPLRATLRVVENGPYLVSGGLPLNKEIIGTNAAGESVRWTPGESFPKQDKYALCRCGRRG